MSLETIALRAAPILFVLIWSTGWISGGFAAPFAEPLTFLTIRFALAAALLALIAAVMRAPWPGSRAAWLHALMAGALIHGGYLAGVWVAIRMGLPSGISGMIAALQPIMTVALAPLLLGERVSAIRWLGTAVGFAGIILVLAPKLVGLETALVAAVALPIVFNVFGMLSVTLGTFYQKRFLQTGDLRSMTAIQYVGALLFTVPLMLLFEDRLITWNMTVILTMAWSVLGLSLGGIGLYLWLIRRGEVSRASALIYLVPPTVAVQAWAYFGERLTAVQLIGLAVTVVGVLLAVRPQRPST